MMLFDAQIVLSELLRIFANIPLLIVYYTLDLSLNLIACFMYFRWMQRLERDARRRTPSRLARLIDFLSHICSAILLSKQNDS